MTESVRSRAVAGSPGAGAATLDALRRVTGTRARRVLLAVTLLLGVLGALGLALGAPLGDRTIGKLSDTAQSLMSITVPAFGVLLVRDLKRAAGTRLAPTLLAATLFAAGVGLVGFLICVAALALGTPSTGGPWRHAGIIALGSVLVQVVAQLVGTGLGLLIRRPGVAFVASIVVPLGLWLLFGAVPVLGPAAQPLTPYAAARHLLSGQLSALNWVQWLGVVLIWGVGLNAAGWGLSRHGRWSGQRGGPGSLLARRPVTGSSRPC
jgi:hypothetical protein